MSRSKTEILLVEDDRPLHHALRRLLEAAGFAVTSASDVAEATGALRRRQFDLILLDVGLPEGNGLDVLASLGARRRRPKVVVMTADDTPETLLRAVREQAYAYISKPCPPNEVVERVKKALSAPHTTAVIEVLSARPDWVELLVPCEVEAAERIQDFLAHLKTDLPDGIREAVGRAFRELLLNAIEWGGRLDPSRKVRISYLRARRMLMYRIADPGPGFRLEALAHSAVANPPDKPLEHMRVREEKGLRPGGFGILLIRQMVDELLYNEARNEVVFVKYLD